MARAVSIGAHPFVLLPATALLAAAQRGAGRAEIAALVALFACLIVAIGGYAAWRVRSGRWTHIDASASAERRELNRHAFIVLALAAVVAGLCLSRREFVVPLAAGAALLLVCQRFAQRLTISHHVAFAVLAAGWLWPRPLSLVLLLLVVMAIAWSRLRLARHTPAELAAGAALGASAAGAVAFALR
ncbi:hypothetical protein [Solimonas flava]|uniref:hypothetical protein n=1 Tax=Solimonas flava TaxID=415849 RepID=UPI0004144E58|nr:hypothetical protein [Solimonas flava]